MADTGSATSNLSDSEKRRIVYVAVVLLVVIAALSVLLSPRGTGASSCNSIFQQDKDNCIEAIAANTNNVSMCSTLQPPYSDQCYLTIAENKSDTQLCGSISSQDMADQCYMAIANSTGNAQVCDYINGTGGDACRYTIALKTNSSATCGTITNSTEGLACNTTLQFNRALSSGNFSRCSYITTNNDSALTYLVLADSKVNKDVGLLLNVSQLVEYSAFFNLTLGTRDICYTSGAYLTANGAYCGEVQNATVARSCQILAGERSSNMTAVNSTPANFTALLDQCNGQSNVSECKDGVYYLQAISTKNVTPCNNIPQSQSYQCYFSIAQEYNSTKYCGYIQNATLNNDCLLAIEGVFANNASASG